MTDDSVAATNGERQLPGRVHSIPAVADGLDTSPNSVRRLIRNGELEVIYIGASVRITDRSYRRLLKTGTRRPRTRGKK